MSLWQTLKSHADSQPDKIAIDSDAQQISYQQLQVLADRCADYFISQGLKPGDRVAILALNHPNWFAALFAAAQCGVILVPLNWRLSVDELTYAVEDCSPGLLLHDENFVDNANKLQAARTNLQLCDFTSQEFPPASEPDNILSTSDPIADTDPLLIVYTSGTTGRPKGAVLSQKALICSAEMSRHMLDLKSEDRVLNVLPLFHVGGLNIQPLPALLNGATLILPPRFIPDDAIRTIIEKQVTLMTVVPTVLQAMLSSPVWNAEKFNSVRAFAIGSTDVPVSLINSVQQQGIPVIQVYGATETSPVAIYQCLEHAELAGSIGRAGTHCEIKLTDENNLEVATGESGEIQVKGDNILSYYWNNDQATSNSIDGGWFKTGDIAHRDEAGFYWFDDRLKHVVISGGENIYPAELERVIAEVPGVKEVAVVGQPDDRWGEVPVAVVAGSAVKQDVLDACSQLARFKHPRDVVFVDTLPRNALGKVQVQLVKELITDAPLS